MKHSKTFEVLTAAALLTVAPIAVNAATICAEPTGAGGCQTTIQAAVNLAAAGDTIDIQAGIYQEAVSVPTGLNGLKLIGAGATIDGTGVIGTLLLIASDNVSVAGLRFRNGQDRGIVIGDGVTIPAGAQITDVTVVGMPSACLFINGADNVVITGANLAACGSGIEAVDGPDMAGSDFLSIQDSTVTAGGDCVLLEGDEVEITGSKISRCSEEGIELRGASAVVAGNTITIVDGDGIYVEGDSPSVQKNKLSSIEDAGISIFGGIPTVNGNKAVSTGGIFVGSNPCDGGNVEGNKVKNTHEDHEGIYTECESGMGIMVVAKNKVQNAMDDCFETEGANLELTGNKASGCGGDSYEAGFFIDSALTTVTGNSAKLASEHGFEISEDNVTLTGNKSTGNYGSGFASENASIGILLTANSSSGNTAAGFAVNGLDELTFVDNTSSKNSVDLCVDEMTAILTDGMGNSFSFAMPPVCAYDR